MRKRTRERNVWSAGLLSGVLLLGACGDPGSGDAAPADLPDAPRSAAPPDPGASPSSAPPSATTRRRVAGNDPAEAPKVLYLGDSLAMENQTVLGAHLRDALGARYRSAPYSGTTLCDYLEGTGEDSLVPDKDKAAALVRAQRPDYVVLQFWGNAWGYTPCMDGITYDKQREKYYDRYAADARRLTAQIHGAGGARVVWVLQGPDPITPDRVRGVNDIYEAQAKASDDIVADAGRSVAPASGRYTWVDTLPCTAYEKAHSAAYCRAGRAALHRGREDYLHFCLAPTTAKSRPCPVRSPGIRRMASAIAGRISADHATPLG
ncbi:SGNH hydrolase domain-containing protein [Streptomyces sp. NPDC058284]|uniref:SGNH hydrolase domain-containing protein n=1 Tax=unclassified Streptomyces TaxID=2593676 RepID=UPI0036533DD5